VAERDRLAAALARAGDRAGAAALKKLRKPTRAVWALNQLAREDEATCEALFTASDELMAVQKGRGDVNAFREALARQRGLFDELSALARRLLEEAQESADEATLTRVTRGLRAAAAGGEVRELLRQGALVEEPDEPGFLSFGAASVQAAPGEMPAARHDVHPKKEPASDEAASTRSPSREEARRERLQRAQSEAAKLAQSAAEALTEAQTFKEESEKQEEAVRHARDVAVAELARLREAVAAAEAKAQELGALWGKRKRALVEANSAWEAARARAAHLDAALADAEKAAHALSPRGRD